jgi:type IV secretory pathway protease TraF
MTLNQGGTMSTLVNVVHSLGQLSGFASLTMAVAIVAFGLAVTYVFKPTEQKLVLMRPVSLAAIFATVSGLLGGWIALLSSLPATPDGHLPVADLYRGIAESLIVGFVSFGLLAAAWMLVAVGGLRRHVTS